MVAGLNRDTRIDLLRHGEPVGGSRYRGQVDDALSEKGWQQMWQAVAGHSDWQQIITSPLQRCQAFADQLAEQHGMPVHSEPRFSEVGFGVWEGKTRVELEQQFPGQLVRFYQDPVNQRPTGAEPLDDFLSRVQDGFDELLSRFAGQTVLIVAHAGVIRAILVHVLKIPPAAMYRIHVENAGMTRLRTDGERSFKLLAHGVG
jgi:alpha-ribazole phosphatase/probable phosphoglycerate mutase